MKKLPERYSYFHRFTETLEEKSEESKFLLFYSYTYMFELSLMPLGNSKFQYLIAANYSTFFGRYELKSLRYSYRWFNYLLKPAVL